MASVLTPGTGMYAPRRYSASMTAVNASFFRMSATRKALRIVESIRRLPYSMTWQVPPAASMRSRAVLENPWAWTVSFLVSSPRPRILTGMFLRVPRPAALQRVEVDRRAVVELALQVGQVDRLGVRPERLERHRHLLVRAAQLAHPHVDRVLAALEARAVLGARARAVALLAAAGGLARAGALAAADALARPARAGGRLEVVEPDELFGGLGLLVSRPSLLLDDHEMPDLVDHPAQLRGVLALDGLADAAQARASAACRAACRRRRWTT